MTRTLAEVITDWELKNSVNVRTIAKAKEGGSIRPGTAYDIAKALGCTEEEAKQYASEASESKETA
ncbi:MAG TPA: hypothetical protein VL588_11390 [Bdellovibrionota bacterium]|nr:hypothetical protein [Bdellovibrionota bacterium]